MSIKTVLFKKSFWKKIKQLVAVGEIKMVGRGFAVLTKANGDIEQIELVNIVTNEGDKYYAQMAMGETPDTDFTAGGLRLGTGTTAPAKTDSDVTTFISGSGKAVKSGYPKTADDDADNTGDGVDIATWTFEYLTSEANAVDIAEGAIVNNITTPTAALSHFLFATPFTKTSSDTLKVIVNHQFNGV